MLTFYAANAQRIRTEHLAGLTSNLDLTSLSGLPTAHERLTLVAWQKGQKKVLLTALQDAGAPDSMISQGMVEKLGLRMEPTDYQFGTVGQSGINTLGVVRDLHLSLSSTSHQG